MEKILIDLTGPQGNAFYLIGLAKRLSPIIGYNFSDIYSEMIEAEYDDLLDVFDGYFGNLVEYR